MDTPHRNRLVSLAAFASLLIAAGCHKKETAPPPPPPPAATSPEPTASITVTPDTIQPGGSAVLAWRTTDATDVSIEGMGPVKPYGTQNVSPTESATYHLIARGPGGSADATARLTVNVPPQAPQAAAAQTITEDVFEQNVKPVFFDYDAYDIRTDAQTTLGQDAAYLTQHPELKIVIGGYCDERGSVEYNLALGENRANSAKQSLVSDGIGADRIRVVSYGKEKQFCSEHDEACWQQNRRAGFSLDK
ncbi:MAG TPA: peptidoglycan-associated lipoprotein Pal [Acidobacteriaceae bacterium]|nr:peptidoglycan-associated lipoprotein Pal [Acidobacteriaceae bacterium]